MKPAHNKQRGAILVMSLFMIILMLGMGAFALDLGRLYVLKSQMQNAADAAARAGAEELDNRPGAQARARAAILDLLQHDSGFARETDLLQGITEGNIRFYSWIGSPYDADVDRPQEYCETQLGGSFENGRCLSPLGTDTVSRYVEVRLEPNDTERDYTVDLYFLPVLDLIGADTARFAQVNARALAGRQFTVCNYPPLMICNPFEPEGLSFARAADPSDPNARIRVGYSLSLKQKWAAGNFGFLQVRNPGGQFTSGAVRVGEYLADPNLQECTPPQVRTQPGAIESFPTWGWNTRFDHYTNQFRPRDYPPAPNVIEYPRDIGGDEIVGNGQWRRDEYWTAFHSYHGRSQPPGYTQMTRHQLYEWELDEGLMPCDPNGPDGEPGTSDDINCLDPLTELPAKDGLSTRDPWATPEPDRTVPYVDPSPAGRAAKPIIDGLHNPANRGPVVFPDRRVLFAAVLDCAAQNITGRTNATADTFAKFFILQTATQRRSEFVVEYMGLAGRADAEFNVSVQLYE
ncbi:Putative Flp pilus-assembly TadE/G-like [Ectothiorhodosinus mongolicus]|uniref:Putative Flp pilus-assembly TadE/G-like n=1 Tax=Ectothiorhodosinus mongolicus TaxID=233100 RepID=A0A1R3VR77_9GAMM|nr:pilus assembly protein TadG-related protein [Ectothiorhodosinus mongolicus]ULX57769.1 hypothetical protein CKX93_08980 [Ectothiorhodosinus mongolicus]SIT65632.1 Putative Flp pilus-assembly TadE/G-like [Ectothiorhodosinus mongolicus]